MSINYEIHTISNSQGSGTARHFARIVEGSPMSAQQLEHLIQDNSTLKKGDIEATLSELREQMVRELSQGHRFYIPNVGYFSLSVKLDADGKAVEKVSGGDLRLHNITSDQRLRSCRKWAARCVFVVHASRRSRWCTRRSSYSRF